ncbi:hypothetical protein C0995_005399, partial [Termitomyces sp. Mi166
SRWQPHNGTCRHPHQLLRMLQRCSGLLGLHHWLLKHGGFAFANLFNLFQSGYVLPPHQLNLI